MRVVRLLSPWITLTAFGIAVQSASNLASWTARLSPVSLPMKDDVR
jgi:hypothetical protein